MTQAGVAIYQVKGQAELESVITKTGAKIAVQFTCHVLPIITTVAEQVYSREVPSCVRKRSIDN